MTERQAARLGQRIAQRRRVVRVGLRTLAERSGVDHTWLHRLERGEFTAPDPGKLARVLEILSIRSTPELAARLPEMHTYFRAKYDLTPDQIGEVERYVAQLRRQS